MRPNPDSSLVRRFLAPALLVALAIGWLLNAGYVIPGSGWDDWTAGGGVVRDR